MTTPPPPVRQDDVVAFLSTPPAFGLVSGRVTRIDTHAAMIFLCGDLALKLKRAVKLPYLDFSTLQQRRQACERELELNQPWAPQIYLGCRAVTHTAEGGLEMDGNGTVVDYVVAMRRFDTDDVLDHVTQRHELTRPLIEMLAGDISAYHRAAPTACLAHGKGAAQRMEDLVENILSGLAMESAGILPTGDVAQLSELARRSLTATRAHLDRRARDGFVRRCHGDLHLGNIVRIADRAVLFDALEFDEDLATIDVLYDIAFLIMDLVHRGEDFLANRALNAWLEAMDEPRHLDALALLPLYLACRAAVRALAAKDRARLDESAAEEARAYLTRALFFFSERPPRLVAIGGLSGSGKSTIARLVAHHLGRAPGAVVLRSDAIRKQMHGAALDAPLDDTAYAPAVTAQVYNAMRDLAARALNAGHSAILDAVHARPPERAAAAAVAHSLGIEFHGVWLTADASVLANRVAARQSAKYADASDADAAVVARQLSYDLGPMTWLEVDANGDPDTVAARVMDRIGLAGP